MVEGVSLHPPKIAEKLAERLLLRFEREEKLGDLAEVFAYQAETWGRRLAVSWYWGQIFRAAPGCISNNFYWSYVMLKNYIKTALRSIHKQKLCSGLNVLGLAFGIACSFLIGIHIKNEMSFDRFFPKADRIYRMTEESLREGGRHFAAIPPAHGDVIQDFIPEIEATARLFYMQTRICRTTGSEEEPKTFEEKKGFFADPSVLEIFDLELLLGNPKTVLDSTYKVILSQETAKKYFGKQNPVGKKIDMYYGRPMVVTGVFKTLPWNTHFNIDFLVSVSTMPQIGSKDILTNRNWNAMYTYVLLRPQATRAQVEAKIQDYLAAFYEGEGTREEILSSRTLNLQPLTSIHLHSKLEKEFSPNGNIAYVYIFSGVALFILLIAGFNFINISSAQAFKRMKEVGIRKTVGAERSQVIIQFLLETLILTLLAAGLAVLLLIFFLPMYNSMTGLALTLSQLFNPVNIAVGMAIVLLISFLAGIYPALFMASFRPAASIRGQRDPHSAAALVRKGLVVFQFVISIFLIFSTLTISGQMNYVRERDLGFDKDQVLAVQLYGNQRQYAIINSRAFKTELLNHSGISGVTLTSILLGMRIGMEDFRPLSTPEDRSLPSIRIFRVDKDFVETMNLEMVEGRSFKSLSPEIHAYIVNESAVKLLALENTVGTMAFNSGTGEGEIMGVVKDFHFASLHNKIEPLVLAHVPRRAEVALINMKGGSIPETLAFIRQKFEDTVPSHPLVYTFLDEYINLLYQSDLRMGSIFRAFSLLAILIACLGLFGLSSYAAEIRIKEIGIRKVLGASVPNLVTLLSMDFAKLILGAMLVAWPLGYWAMSRWLQNFAYRTGIGLSSFLLSGILALAVALITVSYQSIKAALSDPVRNLRYE